MNLKLFTVLKEKKDLDPAGDIEEKILLNLDHIVSLKPINIMAKGTLIKGFWIRMSNNKKYKATLIPSTILKLFGNTMVMGELNSESDNTGNSVSMQ